MVEGWPLCGLCRWPVACREVNERLVGKVADVRTVMCPLCRKTRVGGEDVVSTAEVVQGTWKRLLTSNFLMDGASGAAGVVDLVEFGVVVDVCAEPDGEVDM